MVGTSARPWAGPLVAARGRGAATIPGPSVRPKDRAGTRVGSVEGTDGIPGRPSDDPGRTGTRFGRQWDAAGVVDHVIADLRASGLTLPHTAGQVERLARGLAHDGAEVVAPKSAVLTRATHPLPHPLGENHAAPCGRCAANLSLTWAYADDGTPGVTVCTLSRWLPASGSYGQLHPERHLRPSLGEHRRRREEGPGWRPSP
jgi:hypothetical protein